MCVTYIKAVNERSGFIIQGSVIKKWNETLKTLWQSPHESISVVLPVTPDKNFENFEYNSENMKKVASETLYLMEVFNRLSFQWT